MKLKIYCGDYFQIPVEIAEGLEIVGNDTRYDGNHWVEQSELLFTRALAEDVPVNIFTNNDHFLNGIRVAIMKVNRPIVRTYFYLAEEIEVLFYEKEGHHQSLLMNSRGKLSSWPPGFFDAIENALMKL